MNYKKPINMEKYFKKELKKLIKMGYTQEQAGKKISKRKMNYECRWHGFFANS